MVSVLLAIAAAFTYGFGVALQHREAAAMADDEALHLSLLGGLVRRPLWLLGIGCDVIGFGFQAAALARGALIVVEPIVATSLVFSLVTVAAFGKARLGARQFISAGAVVLGLSGFLMAAAPSTTSDDSADLKHWLLCGGVVAGVVLLLALWAQGRPTRQRSCAIALAGGVANGFVAVTSKAFAQRIDHDGFLTTLKSWEPYVLAGCAVVAILMIQSAYQADAPELTFPLIEVTGPLTASAIGLALFGEHVSVTPGRFVAVVFALIIMGAGIVTLGRDPLIAAPEGPPGQTALS